MELYTQRTNSGWYSIRLYCFRFLREICRSHRVIVVDTYAAWEGGLCTTCHTVARERYGRRVIRTVRVLSNSVYIRLNRVDSRRDSSSYFSDSETLYNTSVILSCSYYLHVTNIKLRRNIGNRYRFTVY